MPPARSKPAPRKTVISRFASVLSGAVRRLVPTRNSIAYTLVAACPPCVGVGLGLELGVGWGLVAGGVGAFGVGWLLGAE